MHSLIDIFIYPIKSVKGISQPAAMVEEKGLCFDRRYMLIDADGTFITGRTHPQLTQVAVQFSQGKLHLSAPKMQPLVIDPAQFSDHNLKATIWSDNVDAQHCHPDNDAWFSAYLKLPCQLVFFSEQSQRCVKNKKTQVGFADGYPLLLVNQTSVDFLNEKLQQPVSALHFRPNIVINTEEAFAEDSWARIKIGEVEFEVSKPCSRCNFTNVDPKTGEVNQTQPLATLATFRQHQGDIDFGQNLIPLNNGIIRAGDTITILATHEPIHYEYQSDAHSEPKQRLNIHYQDSAISVQGNNQQLVLDQAELAGVTIPYSCRGGKCGRCKVKLLKGEVTSFTNEGLSAAELAQGYILACSSIPHSNITLSC